MHKSKSRGNGTGTAYKRGRTWTAQVVIGWKVSKDGTSMVPIKRRKGGFASRKEAINACAGLLASAPAPKSPTLQQIYDRWETFYAPRVGSSTMDDYKYAFKHFSRLSGYRLDQITPDDLQKCLDDCQSGHRTHQNMKCVAGLLWKYAMDQKLAHRNIAENLFIGRGSSVQREPLTAAEVEKIRKAIPLYRYADYIYCLCYLGFRPGEMLELRKDQLFCSVVHDDESDTDIPVWYFINGKKTAAGKDRVVVVPDQILDIVLSRLYIPGTDLVFPMYQFDKKDQPSFRSFKPMSHGYFREHVFKPMLKNLSIADGKVPYCARHTYADLLKNAAGSDRDKAAMIGHSKYLFTQSKYQSTNLMDLKAIVDSFHVGSNVGSTTSNELNPVES